MESSSERTLEDVDTILHYAKLGLSDVLPTVQCLSLVQNLDSSSMKLLEVDHEILDELTAGESITIRGEKADSAVLCTRNKTYDLREAETSNNLLMLPHCMLGNDLENDENRTLLHRTIIAIKQEYYEVRAIRPRLKRLKLLLEENVYAGKEVEDDEKHQGKKYTFEELQSLIQASDQEIVKGLQHLNACLIDGCWRLLDFDFVDSMLTNILVTIDENSMDFSTIHSYKIISALEDLYPIHIVEHVIRFFSTEQLSVQQYLKPSSFKDGETIPFSEDKICRFTAENFLKLNQKYNLNEFEKVWQAAVPTGMTTSMDQLEGMVLIDRDSQVPVIKYFPVGELPEDIEDRFNALFRTKAKWSMDEIKPFIKDLATEKTSVGVLLTKYARASTQGGIKVYNSKKPIV